MGTFPVGMTFLWTSLAITLRLPCLIMVLFFHLNIYSPSSQESVGGAIGRLSSNYPEMLPEMPRYYNLVEVFFILVL